MTRLAWAHLPFDDVHEYDGFEALVLDLLGKAWEVPTHQILGGALRNHVAVSAWSGHRTPDDAAALAAAAVADGFSNLKLKCDGADDIVAIALAVDQATDGTMTIVFDANERLDTLEHAIDVLRGLEEIGNVAFMEDPLPRNDLTTYAELRKLCSTPIAVHIALGLSEPRQDPRELSRAFKAGAADAFNITAGAARFLRMCAAADLMERPCWHGSGVDLGVLEAVHLHAAACAAACTLPSDIFGRRIREHDLLVNPIEISGGIAVVPHTAGLGVSLDLDAVARYTTDEATYGKAPTLTPSCTTSDGQHPRNGDRRTSTRWSLATGNCRGNFDPDKFVGYDGSDPIR